MESPQTFWEFLRWVAALMVAVVSWVYAQDRKDNKERHAQLDKRINHVEASRPERNELTQAVDGLREELRTDVMQLRSDVVNLNRDVTARLDTVIARLTLPK